MSPFPEPEQSDLDHGDKSGMNALYWIYLRCMKMISDFEMGAELLRSTEPKCYFGMDRTPSPPEVRSLFGMAETPSPPAAKSRTFGMSPSPEPDQTGLDYKGGSGKHALYLSTAPENNF